jgi:MFS transporter, DHA2 family, methylenomycin A resistance protein
MENCSESYPNKWWVLIGFGLSITILNLDVTIVNLALPVIARIYHINLSNLQWINNSFTLASICVTLLSGYFADQLGRRKIYLWGMAIFALGSLIASIALDSWMITAGRTLQGMGIGISFPLTLILIGESFPEHERGAAMGLLSTFAGVSQGLGPTVGGILVQWLGWRWAFIINLPICPVVMLIIWSKCQAGLTGSGKKQPIHFPSVVLLIAGLVAILTALNQINQWGVYSAAFLLTFGGGVILLITMLIQQLWIPYPWIDLSLFKNRTYAAINIIRPIFQFIFFGFYFILPLYLQNFLGYSPAQSGYILLLMSGAMGILAPLAGRYIDRIGAQIPLIIAQCSIILGFSVLTLTAAHLNIFILGFGLMALGIATGIMFPTSNYVAVNSLPPEKKGVGMGIFTTTAGLMNSMGIAISGAILSLFSISHFNHLAAQTGLAALGSQPHLQNIISGAQPLHFLGKFYPDKASALLPIAKQSFLSAFHAVMVVYAALAVVALFFCRFISSTRH